jgi:UPF0716 protein FxsA
MSTLLVVVFLVVPIVELAVIIQVGQVVGVAPTLLALIGISILGATLVRREGVRSWRRFRQALDESRLPAAEVVDGALVLLGGALMVTPGFVTDGVGLLLVIPVSREIVNRFIRRRVRSGFGLPPARRRPAERPPTAEVIDVQPVDDPGEDRDQGS